MEQRQIKFRAWDGKEMFYPKQDNLSAIWNKEEGTFLMQILEQETGTGRWADEKNCILMQYTGLKDKNGVEIYEGDILKVQWCPKNLKVTHSTTWDIQFTAEHFMSAWGADDGRHYYTFCNAYDPTRYAEIIGNIFQHQHLLPNP